MKKHYEVKSNLSHDEITCLISDGERFFQSQLEKIAMVIGRRC